MSRWNDPGSLRRAGKLQSTRSVRVLAFSAMRSLGKRGPQLQLNVRTQELGSWPYGWNESPLIGLLLLLALAPDEHLAAKCAAACLMAEGGRDNLQRSIPWRDLKNEAALGELHKGCIQSALKTSHRRVPVVVGNTR